MQKMRVLATVLFTIYCSLFTVSAQNTRTYNQMDVDGNVTQRNDNKNFNTHNNDTTRHKEIPKGFYVWTIDRTLGDITPAEPDTLPHLFPNTILNTGYYGEYNTTGGQGGCHQIKDEGRVASSHPVDYRGSHKGEDQG